MSDVVHPFTIRELGLQDYAATWQAMQHFTATRLADTTDELWLVQHPPVFTLGQAGKIEHIINANHIPIINTDRGGQVTYHAPGQLIIYTLLNLHRLKLNIREIVTRLEQAVIALLNELDIISYAKPDAPGVYVNEAKICALGLRIRRGCCYHGLALNIDMDLTPFSWINPCGYVDLKVTQLRDLIPSTDYNTVQIQLIKHIQEYVFNTFLAS